MLCWTSCIVGNPKTSHLDLGTEINNEIKKQ